MQTKLFSTKSDTLFYLAVALTLIPLWMTDYLPMVDMPQHAGQVVALGEILAGNQVFVGTFELNWFTPYLLGYLSLYALNLGLPILIATKVLVSLAIAALPLATGVLLREVGADSRLRWLVIPGSISFAFYWGLLSFLVAAPLGLYFLACVVRHERNPSLRSSISLSLLIVLLFFSHLLVLAVAGLAAGAYLLAARYRDPKALIKLATPLAAAIPLVVAWAVITYSGESHVRGTPIVYGPMLARFTQLASQSTGVEFFWPISSTTTCVALYLFPLLLGCRLTGEGKRWMLFASGLGLFFSMPANAFGTAFLFERLGVFLLPLWLTLWNPGTKDRTSWELLPAAVIVAVALFNTNRFALFAEESSGFTEILKEIDQGRRVASVVHIKNSRHFLYPVYLHHAAWAQAQAKGIVDFNFGYFYPQLVRYRPGKQTGVNEEFAWIPFNFTWDRFQGDAYDYFLFHSDRNLGYALFAHRTASVPLIARQGNWWLYRNDAPDAAASHQMNSETR